MKWYMNEGWELLGRLAIAGNGGDVCRCDLWLGTGADWDSCNVVGGRRGGGGEGSCRGW